MNILYIFFVILLWISIFGIVDTLVHIIKDTNKRIFVYFLLGVVSYMYLSKRDIENKIV